MTAKPGKAKDLIETDDIGRKAVAGFIEVSKGAKIRKSIQSSTTPDP